MDNFKIFETEQFLEDLEQDFSGRQDKIKLKLNSFVYPQLRQQPYYGNNIKKLINYKPDTWRYRIGNYRFFYTLNDQKKIVYMIAADSRSSAY